MLQRLASYEIIDMILGIKPDSVGFKIVEHVPGYYRKHIIIADFSEGRIACYRDNSNEVVKTVSPNETIESFCDAWLKEDLHMTPRLIQDYSTNGGY